MQCDSGLRPCLRCNVMALCLSVRTFFSLHFILFTNFIRKQTLCYKRTVNKGPSFTTFVDDEGQKTTPFTSAFKPAASYHLNFCSWGRKSLFFLCMGSNTCLTPSQYTFFLSCYLVALALFSPLLHYPPIIWEHKSPPHLQCIELLSLN